MSKIEKEFRLLLAFLNEIYEANPNDWWVYNKERLDELGISDTRERTFFTFLADEKKLIEFLPNENGRDETRMRLTKYGHDNILHLDPILLKRSNNNVRLN